MTKVTINHPVETKKEYLSINQLKYGRWYKVVEYPHNQALVGKIGVAVLSTFDPDYTIQVVTPAGHGLSHPDLRFEEIKNVEISYS